MQADSPHSQSKAGFRRPLRLASGDAVTVKITQETVNTVAGLHIDVEPSQSLSEANCSCITAQARPTQYVDVNFALILSYHAPTSGHFWGRNYNK